MNSARIVYEVQTRSYWSTNLHLQIKNYSIFYVCNNLLYLQTRVPSFLHIHIEEVSTCTIFTALSKVTFGDHRVNVTSVSLELLELSLITSSSLLESDEFRENL